MLGRTAQMRVLRDHRDQLLPDERERCHVLDDLAELMAAVVMDDRAAVRLVQRDGVDVGRQIAVKQPHPLGCIGIGLTRPFIREAQKSRADVHQIDIEIERPRTAGEKRCRSAHKHPDLDDIVELTVEIAQRTDEIEIILRRTLVLICEVQLLGLGDDAVEDAVLAKQRIACRCRMIAAADKTPQALGQGGDVGRVFIRCDEGAEGHTLLSSAIVNRRRSRPL